MEGLLGGKGANLAEMTSMGLPVPPGFTLTTEACKLYHTQEHQALTVIKAQVREALRRLEQDTGATFGDPEKPLLLAIRSGARASMPGMMDTILNLGLNDHTVEGLIKQSGNEHFAYDSYRSFIHAYAEVVLDLGTNAFEEILDPFKDGIGLDDNVNLSAADLKNIIQAYKDAVHSETGRPFPQDTQTQLWQAIPAVLASWQNARAQTYRTLHHIPEDWGTAITIQAMVFGNRDQSSGTGVAFTRNPSTGSKEVYGEFLLNAQGEDLVAGLQTPHPMTEAARQSAGETHTSFEALMPEAFDKLVNTLQTLEYHYRDLQDVEFTIEAGRLWILQARPGKRSAAAAVKIVVDLALEGVLTQDEAVMRIEPGTLERMMLRTVDPSAALQLIATGLPASPGAVTGEIVFHPDDVKARKEQGYNVILVRNDTAPEDIHGMHAADGILTARGGMTSHAAVVARGIGRPCVSGAGALRIDEAAQSMTVTGQTFQLGDTLTIDGATGEVFKGAVQLRRPKPTPEMRILMEWIEKTRHHCTRYSANDLHRTNQAYIE